VSASRSYVRVLRLWRQVFSLAEVKAVQPGAAKAIIELAGVHDGLCIHLGCGRDASAALTADLAAGSSMLVHGIALDDAAMDKARKSIDAAGCPARHSREGRHQPAALPNDLASLVVIEDFDSLAPRPQMDEVMRVTARRRGLHVRGRQMEQDRQASPKEMDDWTHPNHGADGNMVSQDRAVGWPWASAGSTVCRQTSTTGRPAARGCRGRAAVHADDQRDGERERL